MYKLFNTDELRKNGYIRYPRVFLDMLIRNCCKGKRIPTQIGIMLYLYSKVAYSPTNVHGKMTHTPSRKGNVS